MNGVQLDSNKIGETRISCRSILLTVTFIYAIYSICNRFANKLTSAFVLNIIVVSIAVAILRSTSLYFIRWDRWCRFCCVHFDLNLCVVILSNLFWLFYNTEMENLNDLGEYLNTEIVCTLAGLGYSEGSEYYKSPDCLGRLICWKPLIKRYRLLRDWTGRRFETDYDDLWEVL